MWPRYNLDDTHPLQVVLEFEFTCIRYYAAGLGYVFCLTVSVLSCAGGVRLGPVGYLVKPRYKRDPESKTGVLGGLIM